MTVGRKVGAALVLLLAVLACERRPGRGAADAGVTSRPRAPRAQCSLFEAAAKDPCWVRLADECSRANGGPVAAVVTEFEGPSPAERARARNLERPRQKEDRAALWSRGTCFPVIDGGPQPIELVPTGDTTFGEWVLAMGLFDLDGGFELSTIVGKVPAVDDAGTMTGGVMLCGDCSQRLEPDGEGGWRVDPRWRPDPH
jgi:hypothetical protein